MKTAVNVLKLSKRYRLGEGMPTAYRTLRESLTDAVSNCGRTLVRLARNRLAAAPDGPSQPSTIWALKDVSFDIQPGEVVGFIGHNGAGKSTLLKILSRITEPTEGCVRLRGRVGSMLEVGTGFHPELTGRENIYLNGAILGMSRSEIDRKFDAIIAFAEIERFLDTPVKRYSSGMFVRLASAVAIHLEPEILIVDEVLSVGDMAFQKKCIRKMSEFGPTGHTVLFVSHNMSAIKSLCTRAILLEAGRVVEDGDVDKVVNTYLARGGELLETGVIPANASRLTNGEARFHKVHVSDLTGCPVTQLYYSQPFRVVFECEVLKEIPNGHFEVSISTLDGTHVLYCTNAHNGNEGALLLPGRYVGQVDFDAVLLPRGYTVELGVHHQDGTTADHVNRTCIFTVLTVASQGKNHYPWGRTRGLIRAEGQWELQPVSTLPAAELPLQV